MNDNAGNEPGSGPQIHIDSDWKAEAQAEKQRLAKEADTAESKAGPKPGEMPEADFMTLVGTIASQAVMGLGAVRDPKSGGVVVDLPQAKFAIDLLAVIQEKTKGNLTDEEADEVKQALVELRSRFVQISDAVKAQATQGATAAAQLIDPPAKT